jgi:peptide/nickel transport system substrate-binding protein
MKKSVLWLVMSCLLVTALVLSSCGAAEDENGEQPPKKEEPAKDAPIYGGTLTPAFCVQNWAGGPTGWDMVKWTWMGHAYQSFITDALLMGDMTKGPIGTGEFSFVSTDFIPDASVTGALAESWEFTSPTVLRFNIRPGVTWHNKFPTNGRALTVDDLVWAFNRTIGFEEGKGRWPRHSFVKEVRKVDESTLEFEFTDPLAFWGYEVAWGPYLLAYPPESEEAGLDDWRNISGTGPFMVDDYISDVEIVFARNPDWWGTWTKDGETYQLPFLDEIVIPIIAEQSARVAAFRTGKLDIYQMAGMTTKRDLLEISPELEDKLESRQVMRGGGWHFHFPWDKEPFNDIRVRKAINMAIDRQALIDAFYEGVGMVYYWPLQESDGPSVWTPLEETPEIQEYFTYDPDKAQEYLADAGFPNGFKMEFIMGVGDTTADFGAMLQEFWAAVGIEADLKIMEEATIQAMGFDKSFTGLISAGLQARPQSFNDMTRDHAYNFGGWSSDYFEEQWQIAKTTPDIEDRDALLKDLFVYLKSTVPDVLIPSGAEWTAWWPWVKNYGGETSLGFHKHQYWAWAWIDEALKKEMGY